MNEFCVLEKELSEASGISRTALAKKRRDILTEGVDWKFEKNAAALTAGAALRILTELGSASPANVLEKACSGLPAGSGKNGRLLARVVRRFCPNTRAMECRLEKTGELIIVCIRDNRMFNPGQLIPVKKSQTDIHFLDAPQPRKNGHVPGFEEPKK